MGQLLILHSRLPASVALKISSEKIRASWIQGNVPTGSRRSGLHRTEGAISVQPLIELRNLVKL